MDAVSVNRSWWRRVGSFVDGFEEVEEEEVEEKLRGLKKKGIDWEKRMNE